MFGKSKASKKEAKHKEDKKPKNGTTTETKDLVVEEVVEKETLNLDKFEVTVAPDNGKKILAVGSDKAYLHAFEVKLERAGYTAKILHHWLEAMDKIRDEQFDLLLIDLVLPWMNGFKILENIRDEQINLPTMVVTTLWAEEDKEKANEFWVLDFFERKRTTVVELLKAVNSNFNI